MSLDLPSNWIERVVTSLLEHRDGPDPEALKKRLRRLARVYAYGDLGDDEYEAARSEIESQLRQSWSILRPSH